MRELLSDPVLKEEEMILSYCKKCEHHVQVEIASVTHSRCLKENCLSVYAKCFTEEAVRQFIRKNTDKKYDPPDSALEICYPRI